MRRSLCYMKLKICEDVLVWFVLICLAQVSFGATNLQDVAAINSLHAALGTPALPGWTNAGGDPCGEAWQGVLCNDSAIESIILNAANLEGELGENLGSFTSIKRIDLSNNRIGGTIPSILPVTLETFFLSANQFTGSIPISLASLVQLTDMSLNDNLLTGGIPDAFESLTVLVNLDLSTNNMIGELPPSMKDAIALTSLHLQNNQLSGKLDVLQDLQLSDLNIENNLFVGPVPPKLLTIPNFRGAGNPLNSSISPVPSPTSPLAPPLPSSSPPSPYAFWGPPSGRTNSSKAPPSGRTNSSKAPPSEQEKSTSGKSKSFWTTKKKVGIIFGGVIVLLIVLVLVFVFLLPRGNRRRGRSDRVSKPHQIGAYRDRENPPMDNEPRVQSNNQVHKVPEKENVRPKEVTETEPRRSWAVPKSNDEQDRNVQRMNAVPKRRDSHVVDMSPLNPFSMPPPPPPPPPPPFPVQRVIVKPIVPTEVNTVKPSTRNLAITAKSFTVASLQLYTDSFSQDNLIGTGMLGSVYRAQLPNGKLLAVKKLDKRASHQQKDEEFLELVNNIDRIRHANVVELVGYCAEHGQRLLIYEYCSNGSLHETLHSDDEFKKKLTWNTRIRMALEAARSLEYLHEVCQPPIVHRNFKSNNLLLDDDLSIRISDCGLASLISSGSVSQLSGHLLSAYGYGAPEFESGIYTHQSDVYSFGVVMLELLTGRKSYDRTRTRGEQFLVRWALTQLHDIDALSRMVDPSLNREYPTKSLSHFADIISRCVQSEPEFRPPMSEVVQDLLDMIRREPRGS